MGSIPEISNKALMASARESLKGSWGLAVGATVVYLVILVLLQFIPILGYIVSQIIAGPMYAGLVVFFLAVSRKQNPQIPQLFEGFKKFWVALGAYLLSTIFVILWSLLLIVPGIIAGLSYAMTFYIIAEDDSIGPLEAIKKSKEIMQGNKWRLFCLGFRFIGWILLCIPTLGIGYLWVFPYMMVSYAKFYDDLVK
jgi:uncharacterized membrane protein